MRAGGADTSGIDLGTPEARTHLWTGWGPDESHANVSFVWGVGDRSTLDLDLAPLPEGVRFVPKVAAAARVVHAFAVKREKLEAILRDCRGAIAADAAVWVSWPKKAAKVPTDITEDAIRESALPLGFVDVKVCAVDETWSGLKLVIRKELR